MSRSRRIDVRAFTLIELLVTVMILLVLAGLLIPAISGARERSRDILCKNNLKQLQIAAMSCAINGDGSLPYSKTTEKWDSDPCPHGKRRAWRKYHTGWVDWENYTCHHHKDRNYTSNDARPGETVWWGPYGLTSITNGALWNYVRSTKAYACPEWQRMVNGKLNAPDGAGKLSLSDTNTTPWRCYGMNENVSGKNIGDIEGSKHLLFAEQSLWVGSSPRMAERKLMQNYSNPYGDHKTEALGWDGSITGDQAGSNPYPKENIGLYHQKSSKANAVFVDGHIEKLLWTDTTNACFGIW